MGLGKTVQTLARVVQGKHTAAEKKSFRGGTLLVVPSPSEVTHLQQNRRAARRDGAMGYRGSQQDHSGTAQSQDPSWTDSNSLCVAQAPTSSLMTSGESSGIV